MAKVKQTASRTRALAVLELVSGRASAQEIAREHAVAESELTAWHDAYLAQVAQQLSAPLASSRLRFAALWASAGALLASLSWLAPPVLSQSLDMLVLKEFKAGSPALAKDFNDNFNALRDRIEEVRAAVVSKIGSVTTVNPVINQPIQQDMIAASEDVHFEGGSTRIALRGDVTNQRLVINGSIANPSQSDPTRYANGTLINADLEVGGRIRQQHYRVDAPYVPNRPSETNNVTAIDMPVFRALCADDDGCTLTMILKDYDSTHNRDASFGPVHFEYDARGPTHGYQTAAFATSDNYAAGYASTDNDGTTGDAIRAWNCFLSDSNYTLGSGAQADNSESMYLVNYTVRSDLRGSCVLLIDD